MMLCCSIISSHERAPLGRLAAHKPLSMQVTRKRMARTARGTWRHAGLLLVAGWQSGWEKSYTAILVMVTEHFTVVLRDVKQGAEQKRRRKGEALSSLLVPSQEQQMINHLLFFDGEIKGKSFSTWDKHILFYAVYITTWHHKLLQDDLLCYWLTAQYQLPAPILGHPDTTTSLQLCPQTH